MAKEKEGAPPEEATRAWPVVFAVYAGATLVYGLLAGVSKAVGLEIFRSLMTWPALLLLCPTDTAVNSVKVGLIYGAIVLLPLIGFVRTRKTRWLVLECAFLVAGPIAFVVWYSFFFDVPLPH